MLRSFRSLNLFTIALMCIGATGAWPLEHAHAQAKLTGVALDEVPREVLQEILETAGVRSARVSSYQRTARKQAEIMYGICRSRRGVTKARRTYSAAAERIIDVYWNNRKKKRAQIIALMTAETKRVLADLGPARTTLMHVDSRNYTFDVAPSSIGKRHRKRFAAAIKAHPDVVRVLEPGVGSERAYHIEVPRTLAPMQQAWVGTCTTAGASGHPSPTQSGENRPADDSEPLAVSLSLRKTDSNYRGTLVVNAEVSEWRARLDRRGKQLFLTGAEHAPTGQLSDDYRSLTLTLGPLACTLAKPADS